MNELQVRPSAQIHNVSRDWPVAIREQGLSRSKTPAINRASLLGTGAIVSSSDGVAVQADCRRYRYHTWGRLGAAQRIEA